MPSKKNKTRPASLAENISGSSDTRDGSALAREVQLECDRLAEQIAHIPALVRQRLSEAEEVQCDGLGRRHANPDLIARLEQAEHRIKYGDATIKHLTAELDLYKHEIQDLRAKEQSLRNFMHENECYPEASEDEVVAAFVGVRQKVQKLVSSRMYRMDGKELPTESDVFAGWKELSGLWQKATQPNRRLLLRALVYKSLVDEILSNEFFGIVEPKAKDSSPSSTIEKVVAGLSQFERILVKNKVSNEIVTNWRLSTLKSVEAIGMTQSFGTALAEQMYDYFTAFVVEEVTQEARRRLFESFVELCNEAYALRLLMRKSKTDYWCLSMEVGTTENDVERCADVYGELEDTGHGRSRVALTLFGALGVYTPSSPDGIRILERAQVLVARG
ncbi:hypothetical protein NW762_013895 [Fusarium torreyae]|uniref:Uncharacterized protein n=1 Tax=Fusarium torreyae TaxID=1237075 RepID=A0A9W8RLD2_9HYPO|nr:hypothetical protein NW762_013895 [Fusarium torreyae]